MGALFESKIKEFNFNPFIDEYNIERFLKCDYIFILYDFLAN